MELLNRPNRPLLKDLRNLIGSSNPRMLRSFEDLFDAVPSDLNEIITDIDNLDVRVTQNEEDIDSLEARVDDLEPNFITIDSTDSPYAAANNDYITADMSVGGNIDVTGPSSGRFYLSRDGATDTLTIIGTVNGVVNPTVLFNGTTLALWHNGTELRYG